MFCSLQIYNRWPGEEWQLGAVTSVAAIVAMNTMIAAATTVETDEFVVLSSIGTTSLSPVLEAYRKVFALMLMSVISG